MAVDSMDMDPIEPRLSAEVVDKRGDLDLLRRDVLQALKGNDIRDYPLVLFDGLPLIGVPSCITSDTKLTPQEKLLFDTLNDILEDESNHHIFSEFSFDTLQYRLEAIKDYVCFLASKGFSGIVVFGKLVKDHLSQLTGSSEEALEGGKYFLKMCNNVIGAVLLVNQIVVNYKYRPLSTDRYAISLTANDRKKAKDQESEAFLGLKEVKQFVKDNKIGGQDLV